MQSMTSYGPVTVSQRADFTVGKELAKEWKNKDLKKPPEGLLERISCIKDSNIRDYIAACTFTRGRRFEIADGLQTLPLPTTIKLIF